MLNALHAGSLTRQSTDCPLPVDDCNMVCSAAYRAAVTPSSATVLVTSLEQGVDDCDCNTGHGSVAQDGTLELIFPEETVTLTLTSSSSIHADINSAPLTCSAVYAVPVPDKSASALPLPIIAGGAGGFVLLAGIAVGVVMLRRRKRRQAVLGTGDSDDDDALLN